MKCLREKLLIETFLFMLRQNSRLTELEGLEYR